MASTPRSGEPAATRLGRRHRQPDDGDLIVGEWPHPALARQRRLDVRREHVVVARTPVDVFGELGQHLGGEELRAAVRVAAALAETEGYSLALVGSPISERQLTVDVGSQR